MSYHRIPGGRHIDPRRLKAARLDNEMHQSELAAASGVSRGLIASIEQGTRNGSIETLRLLAAALHREPAQLLDGEPDGQRSRIVTGAATGTDG